MTTVSPRLRPGVRLHETAEGHVLRVARGEDRVDHQVDLAPSEVHALMDALLDGGAPDAPAPRAALDSLVAAGLVDPAPAAYDVRGAGLLATALRGALARAGAALTPDGETVTALDTPPYAGEKPDPVLRRGVVCWLDDDLALLAPPGVPAVDVAARRRAATRHRDTDPRTRPVPGGRSVTAPTPAAGLELAAAVVAAELVRGERPAHTAVVVDLGALTVTHRPVLPVPPAPR